MHALEGQHTQLRAARVGFKDDRGGDAFTREVHRNIWGLKGTLEDVRKQQDRLEEKYDKLSNDVNQLE